MDVAFDVACLPCTALQLHWVHLKMGQELGMSRAQLHCFETKWDYPTHVGVSLSFHWVVWDSGLSWLSWSSVRGGDTHRVTQTWCSVYFPSISFSCLLRMLCVPCMIHIVITLPFWIGSCKKFSHLGCWWVYHQILCGSTQGSSVKDGGLALSEAAYGQGQRHVGCLSSQLATLPAHTRNRSGFCN